MTLIQNDIARAVDSRAAAAYQNAVRNTFAYLKETTRLDDLYAKSLPLPCGGFLVPVCALHTDDESLIRKLADWREEHNLVYPSQFQVTAEGTARWLKERLLDVEDRLLFLVTNKHGDAIGHLGLANALSGSQSAEIDNVIRGVVGANRGIMSEALLKLIDWTEEMLAPGEICLRVFEENSNAIAFYRRLGFRAGSLLPLRRHDEESGTYYRDIDPNDSDPPDTHFLRMVYQPEAILVDTPLILTAGPSISARESSYALDATRTGWNNNWSDYLRRFETAFADYVGVRYAIPTSSCTGALQMALLSLGIGPGDEVIVPDITWVATANAINYVGATPVFADVQPDTWCLDPESFESLITARTRAVMPVHLYGHPTDMDRIMDIATAHNLFVIEDAAPAIGAECRGRKVGTYGHFSAFSFQGAKLLVTGEGGMLLTDDEDLYRRAAKIADQGRVPGTFWIDETGWKYKMSNVQAAIGLAQLERIEELIEAKRRIFRWYQEGLAGVRDITLSEEADWARSIYWMSSILLDKGAGITRDGMREALKQRNVDTRPVFPAISRYPIWPRKSEPQPTAVMLADHGINLPSGVCLKRNQVDYVCKAIHEILRSAG